MRASAGDASASDDASRRAGRRRCLARARTRTPTVASDVPAPPSGRLLLVPRRASPVVIIPTPRALPDEVVLRVFRHALADPGAWSVGGRFRPADAPPPGASSPRRLVVVHRVVHRVVVVPSSARRGQRVRRAGHARAVCSQWRRLLDQTCAHIEARRAVLFGDDALVGLARCVGGACERLTLEGNHLEGGRLALTARRGVLDALDAMPSLATLRIERTGMRLDDISTRRRATARR